MDEGVGDDVTTINAPGGTYLQSKESEYTLKPNSSSLLELHEMVTPGEGDVHGNSSHLFENILDGKNVDRIGAPDFACASPHCPDDTGVMVKELTLRNYNSDNLAIVGTSNNRERMQTRQNQWQHLYQIAGGSGSGSSCGDAAYGDKGGAISNIWEDAGYTIFPELMGQQPPNENRNEVMEHFLNTENKPVSSNTLSPCGVIRTKILSKSGFSEYFVKNSLKGKGVICRGPAGEGSAVEHESQIYSKGVGVALLDSDLPLRSNVGTVVPSNGNAEPLHSLSPDAFHDGVSLREWLKAGLNRVNKVKSLYIFRQIVDLVDFFHSQGVALNDIRPSSFKLLPSSHVMYLGSSVQKEIMENVRDQDISHSDNDRIVERSAGQETFTVLNQGAKKRKFGENTNFIRLWPKILIRSGTKCSIQDSENEFNKEPSPKTVYKVQSKSSSSHVSNTSELLSTCINDSLEEKWYASPEELRERSYTFSSNIYCLGVLLFELLSSFESGRVHAAAMFDLNHRILPPKFLSENPMEAGFCLWLLHPDPSSRPTTREVLQSEFVSGIQESCGDELSSSIDQEDADSELLLHFLMSLKEQKQKDSSKLVEEIRCLEADTEEVGKRQTKKSIFCSLPRESLSARGNSFLPGEHSSIEMNPKLLPISGNELRLTRNISQLESAYFSTRSNVQLSDKDVTTRANLELLKSRENWHLAQKDEEKYKPTDCLGVFFSGLCKYARYSKFELRGILRNGDFNNSANVICSLSFDRDEDYFAAAGVSKKIKIYDFHALFNDSVDIHYPVIEMSNKSRLSCVCWNSYIRNYVASTDFDGVVKLWDAGTGQSFSRYIEHNKRAWSVDFSQVDPKKLASGSDDCSVKLWSINEKTSLCTIRNIANVCCVQFSADSSHLLAFGSADCRTYCYDLRNVSTPWCILAGHDKAVSYVKCLDSETLVSASTDNTLKIWDLNKTSSSGLSTNACILTLRGHTNEKNFVGLSVADGYIACGSETNEVFAYYRSLPMPMTSHKFGSIDPISGKETDDDNGQFVSSVCWRRKSNMVVAADSSGCIKLLQLV